VIVLSEKEIIEGTANAIAEHLPKTAETADSVLSTVIGIFDVMLTPFQMLKIFKDSKMKEFKENLAKKIERIPEEARKDTIDLKVVGPALEALKYTFLEDDLREMFENLLASSIDKREDVFPSFIDIVRQLSSDEAKLLKYLSVNGTDYPLIDLNYTYDANDAFDVELSNFTDIGYGVIEKPELISAYLRDLDRFGIIEIQTGVYLAEDIVYKKLENHPFIQDRKTKIYKDPGKYEIEKKKFTITDYGKAFINSCVIDKSKDD